MQPLSIRHRKTPALPSSTHGFSLIEVLVAVLVMGIGVLGITALQMVSLQNNRMALERGEAVQLAYDMMDRIRANPGGVPAGAAYDGLAFDDPPPATADCVANTCTAAQMVDFDQASWKCQLGAFHDDGVCQGLRADGVLPMETAQPGLPKGDGDVAVDAAGVVTVRVRWSGADNQQQEIEISSQG